MQAKRQRLRLGDAKDVAQPQRHIGQPLHRHFGVTIQQPALGKCAVFSRATADFYAAAHYVDDPILLNARLRKERQLNLAIEAQRRLGDFGQEENVLWPGVSRSIVVGTWLANC